MKYIVYITFLVILVTGCKENQDTNSLTYYNVPDLSKNTGEEMITNLAFDSVMLDTTIESSFVGDFWIHHDTLLFSDLYYNYVYRFSTMGSVIDKHLGRGKGPGQVIQFMYSFPFQDGYCFVSTANHYVYLFNEKWKKVNQFRIDWDIKSRFREIMNKPNPKEIQPYELDLGRPDVIKQWDDNHIAVAISASHPKFNGYFNSSLYYNYSRILALVNVKTKQIDELIGRRSPVFLKYSNIPNFDNICFDFSDKELFVTFWPDSFIYIIDKKSKNAIGKFGKAGRNMQVNYSLTQNYEDAEMERSNDWKKYGHYHNLVFDKKHNLLFRGYTKGGDNKKDGLQVYRNMQLIADLDVPSGFKIIGSIGDELYASHEIDRDNLTFGVYKVHFAYEN